MIDWAGGPANVLCPALAVSLVSVQLLTWHLFVCFLILQSTDISLCHTKLTKYKGWVKKGAGFDTTTSILMNSVTLIIILWYSPVFEVFKMGCNSSVGQGTEFITPDIVDSQSQPFFFDSSFIIYNTISQHLRNLKTSSTKTFDEFKTTTHCYFYRQNGNFPFILPSFLRLLVSYLTEYDDKQ